MRIRERILSLLLAGALLLPALPPAKAAEPAESGSVSATVRVDWPQSLEALRDRNVRAELFQDGRSLGSVSLAEGAGQDRLGGYPAEVTLRNQDGGELGGGRWPGYLDLKVSQLPRGEYDLEFTGDGYVTYRQRLSLQNYSKHVTLGTADATFTLGDVNGDGRVDDRDRKALSGALGSGNRRDLERYDLNGDGAIDIYDLTYLTRNLSAKGQAEVRDTVLLPTPVPPSGSDGGNSGDQNGGSQGGSSGGDNSGGSETVSGVSLGGGVSLVSGSLENLLQNNGQTVTMAAAGGPVSFSVSLPEAVEMEEIQIVSPEGPGAMKEGTVAVAYADGGGETFAFDLSLPEGVRAVGPVEGSSVVTISLGRRVAVKEITVTVTRSEGGEYITVESIQFLKDIVPENPTPAENRVRNLTASAGSERVALRWTELPNVSGYRVDYWLQSGGTKQSLLVNVPRAEITGLENLKTYLFTVTPVDGNWEGDACDPVSATPQPDRAPSPPDMVSVGSLDSALPVSWKASENATFYEVWYKPASESTFRQWGGRFSGTSATITGLTNGVEYAVYITAGNHVGTSGPSRTSLGTPAAADYSRPAGIPAEGVLDWTAVDRVWLADKKNVSPTAYPAGKPFQESFMADGDFSTHWTSHSYGDGNWWDSKQVFAAFKRPVDLSSVIWVPRLDGSYANNLRLYTVTVWRQGDDLNGPGTLVSPDPLQGGKGSDHNTWQAVRNNPGVTKFAVLPFTPVTGVVKISVTIEQVAYTAVSLSELMFMEYDPAHCLPDNIADLFTDELRTTLRSGVTQARIDALRTRLEGDEKNYYLNVEALADELKLAEELLKGASGGVLINGVQSRDGGADSKLYQQGGSVLQPLGVAAAGKQEITIYASGIPAGQKLTVYASQFNAEVSAWQAEIGALSNGRNVLTVPQIGSQNTPRGGSLYLSYGGTKPEAIRLHIRRAADIPVLELADWHTLSEGTRREVLGRYVDELEAYGAKLAPSTKTTDWHNVTEISMPSVLLSLPAAAVLGGAGQSRAERIETLYQAVLAWEDVMHICKTTQGIDNTYGKNDMQTRQNIRCMQMFTGAFMYAAGSHIGIGYSSCAGMVCGKPIAKLGAGAQANQLFGWGIAHEIGHNMDKLGKAEITNNLYSLMVQTYDGGRNVLPSRLEKSGKYEGIFSKTAQGLPGDSSDVFVQLGLYWQLHLAYDGGAKPMDFYNRFFKAWKAGTYFGGESGYQDRVARTASAVANRNLTEFFTRWGMTLSDGTKAALAKYPAEERAVWYLNDQSRRDRLGGVPAGQGSVSVTAAKEGEKQIRLTIASTLSQGKLQGYEILRNGVPIGFTAEGTYTDTIGSANHRTYTYSVRAYDSLGNRFGQAQAAEIRIAYDKTVPLDAYTVSREGEKIVLHLKEETPVSGLKVIGAPGSGAFRVDVTDGEGKTVAARSGDFGQGNQAVDDPSGYLTYFQKPGAGAEDTRIWTYDAKTVTVTGVPGGTAEIRLISYAGDDVAFLETGSVGVLSKEYRYGTESGQVIPAGTLVVTGTYRGNPVYQTVKIEGLFSRTILTGDDEVKLETERRWLDGKALLFAEVPEDGEVSDISDGLFLFIPNVQREAELQGGASGCNDASLLPAQMRAVLSRTDLPDAADSQRVTAETLWINTPGGTDLPAIVLEEG